MNIGIVGRLPFVPLVGVTDLESGVDGFSSIFLADGVDAFDDVPDRGECGIRSAPCSIFFMSKPFSRGEAVPLLLCAFGIGLIGLTSDASSTTRSWSDFSPSDCYKNKRSLSLLSMEILQNS